MIKDKVCLMATLPDHITVGNSGFVFWQFVSSLASVEAFTCKKYPIRVLACFVIKQKRSHVSALANKKRPKLASLLVGLIVTILPMLDLLRI